MRDGESDDEKRSVNGESERIIVMSEETRIVGTGKKPDSADLNKEIEIQDTIPIILSFSFFGNRSYFDKYNPILKDARMLLEIENIFRFVIVAQLSSLSFMLID